MAGVLFTRIELWELLVYFTRIAGSSNGRTSPFGGEYLGSNPSPAARAGLSSTRHIWRRKISGTRYN